MNNTRFSYVQIGARDPEALAAFYEKTIGFQKVSDAMPWLSENEGIALKVPGYKGFSCPLFGFVPAAEGTPAKINDAGFAHTCFETEDVNAAVKRLLSCGGSVISTMSHPELHPCVYCKDPEGNIVEFHIPFPSEKGLSEYAKTAACLLGLRRDSALRSSGPLPGTTSVRFLHVNIIAPDYRKLCDFYANAFDAAPFGAVKNHSGSYKSQVIGIPSVVVQGQHMLLPGFHKDCPTLEIFTYSIPGRTVPVPENVIGLNEIGFLAEDLQAASDKIEKAGGKILSRSDSRILAEDIIGGKICVYQK